VRYYKGFFNEQQLPRPCNYVSVMETADFSFSTAYLTTTEFWDAGGHGMGDLNEDVRGEQARVDKETPYACVSSNSDCLTNDEGYLCRCYRGNPYVVGGCTGFLFSLRLTILLHVLHFHFSSPTTRTETLEYVCDFNPVC
jgi:hypothetical protein